MWYLWDSDKWTDFVHTMKMGITGFVGGLLVACERKRGVENDSKVFSPGNWEKRS